MSLTSEYEINLKLQDDTKDAIRELERGLKGVGDIAKKADIGSDMTQNLNDAQEAANEMIAKFREMAKNQELDFEAVSKAFSKNAQKAVGALETQYARLKDQQSQVEDEYKRLTNELARQKRVYAYIEEHGGNAKETAAIIYQTEKQIEKLGYKRLEAQIKQNRQIRASLKAAEKLASSERTGEKSKANADKAELRNLNEKNKRQKAYNKAIEQAEKVTERINNKTSRLGKTWAFVCKQAERVGKATQFAANTTTVATGIARAGMGIARGIASGVSAVAGSADQEVERERQANRIKGIANADERSEILRQIYVRTGADYSTIVDAIGRVQGVLGTKISQSELVTAASIELRYPGMAQTFASYNGNIDVAQFQRYANRMKYIQHATGASEEQIQSSAQMLANLGSDKFGNAKGTELQAVYLGLQNSGAFESQDELDSAFKSFLNKRKPNEDIFEAAKHFGWADYVSGERNKTQAQNTIGNLDWTSIGESTRKQDESKTPEMTKAEQMAMQMRLIEEKKNQLLMKLIPAVLPIVEGIAKLMDSKGDKIVKGLVALFETVIPLLEPVFNALDVFLSFMSNTILPGLQKMIQAVVDWFGNDDNTVITKPGENADGLPQHASGGLAFMPSIVGERGPEAIIPLDYARSQRASNIATQITQNFNMGTGQTTALSLAQAVKSRDFTRAMAENTFITRRMGVL